MDKIIDARFERVEKALQKLVNSISTYNPTPAHATDLLTADLELNQGLGQLSLHQRNHERIVSLQTTSVSLDNQIRENLMLLTDTRRALINTPSTIFPETTNPISYSDLLNYARRISKTTLPSTYREATETAPAHGTSSPRKEDKSEPQTNAVNTPTNATNGSPVVNGPSVINGPSMAMEIDSATPSNAGGPPTQSLTQPSQEPPNSTTALPQDWQKHLNPTNDESFIPWPQEYEIRRGALGSIQILVNSGVDPWTFDPEMAGELEAERKRIEEQEQERLKVEEQATVEEEKRREAARRVRIGGPVASARAVEEQPKVFQLETFDDDDSE